MKKLSEYIHTDKSSFVSLNERLLINKNIKINDYEEINKFLDEVYKKRYDRKYFATLPVVANIFVMLSSAISKYNFQYDSDEQKTEVRDFIKKFALTDKIWKTYTCIRTEDLINAISDGRLTMDTTIQNGELRIEYCETDKYLLLIFGSYKTCMWNIFIGRYL